MNAFSEMIPKDSFPTYALFIDLDPGQLDINVHPTKQEIKFEDDKIVYAFVQAAVCFIFCLYLISIITHIGYLLLYLGQVYFRRVISDADHFRLRAPALFQNAILLL